MPQEKSQGGLPSSTPPFPLQPLLYPSSDRGPPGLPSKPRNPHMPALPPQVQPPRRKRQLQSEGRVHNLYDLPTEHSFPHTPVTYKPALGFMDHPAVHSPAPRTLPTPPQHSNNSPAGVHNPTNKPVHLVDRPLGGHPTCTSRSNAPRRASTRGHSSSHAAPTP
eukprot:355222-Chlamydomonas_euryale.AAC.1